MRRNEFWGRSGRVCVRGTRFGLRGRRVGGRCPQVGVRGDRLMTRTGAMYGRGIRVGTRGTQIPGRGIDDWARRLGSRERFARVDRPHGERIETGVGGR